MRCAIIKIGKVPISRDFSFRKRRMRGYCGGQMKKIIIVVIIFFLSSIKAFAGDGVDGVWVGEGAHGTFELLLSEHEGKILGALITGVGNPRKWKSFLIIRGFLIKNKISITIITDGCDGGEDGGIVVFKGIIIGGDIIKATLALPPCIKNEEILFHKE